jgi:putative transposase
MAPPPWPQPAWSVSGLRLLNDGKDLAEVLRTLEIFEATWNRWRARFGGMSASEAKRLRELEVENAWRKKLVANQALDIDMLKELAEGNF